MNPQGVLRQPRGPPLEAGSTWRNNNGVSCLSFRLSDTSLSIWRILRRYFVVIG